jgi:hypothetical protein
LRVSRQVIAQARIFSIEEGLPANVGGGGDGKNLIFEQYFIIFTLDDIFYSREGLSLDKK